MKFECLDFGCYGNEIVFLYVVVNCFVMWVFENSFWIFFDVKILDMNSFLVLIIIVNIEEEF